jgi:hypothetical protein
MKSFAVEVAEVVEFQGMKQTPVLRRSMTTSTVSCLVSGKILRWLKKSSEISSGHARPKVISRNGVQKVCDVRSNFHARGHARPKVISRNGVQSP